MNKPVANKALEEASGWLVKLEDETASVDVRSEFEVWLRKDPDNIPAFEQVSSVWDDMSSVLDSDRLNWQNLEHPSSGLQGRLWHRYRRGLFSLAAAALVCMGLFLFYPTADDAMTVKTNIGEITTVELQDGSIMILNTDSVVHVDYSNNARLVHIENGEVYFDVKSDPSRPFDVIANENKFRAIGTEFSVRYDEGQINVAVTEGRVLMTSAETDVDVQEINHSRNILVAGSTSELSATKPTNITIESVAEIQRELAWRHGGLIFEQERLEDVVNTFQRYIDIELEIVEPNLKELVVGGYFPVGKTEDMLTQLKVNLDLELVEVKPGRIEIKSAL